MIGYNLKNITFFKMFLKKVSYKYLLDRGRIDRYYISNNIIREMMVEPKYKEVLWIEFLHQPARVAGWRVDWESDHMRYFLDDFGTANKTLTMQAIQRRIYNLKSGY